MRGTWWLVAWSVALGACGNEGAAEVDAQDGSFDALDGTDGQDGGGDAVSPAWYAPDPEGRTTEGNLRDAEPEMVIVTSADLAAEWEKYAAYRTLAGTPARVVTMDQVLAAATGVDDAEALRNYLRERRDAGSLRFVLLGGDAQVVPYRRVESHVTVPLGGTYSADGPAEEYFSELDAEWDADGDGKWGEKDQDLSLADLRGPDIAVGRVPVTYSDEVPIFADKVAAYERDESARATYPLFLSDVASSVPVLGDIDAAEAIEVTANAFFPAAFLDHVRKLYATSAAATKYGGETLNKFKVAQALDDGYPLTFHEGHGSWWNLAVELDGDWVRGLDNDTPTIFASCACLSGDFADIADEPTFDGWTEQGPDDDSAGELLIVRPHGAVAYLGNTGVGLGPVGGAQFLHSFFDALFAQGITRLGEAFDYGRAHLRDVHLTILMVPFSMNDDEEWWTQMILILLGDPALPVWTAEPRALELHAPATYGPGYNELTVQVDEPGVGPAADVTVVLLKDGDLVLRAATDADGNATFRFVPYGPAPLAVRATATNFLPADATIAPAL